MYSSFLTTTFSVYKRVVSSKQLLQLKTKYSSNLKKGDLKAYFSKMNFLVNLGLVLLVITAVKCVPVEEVPAEENIVVIEGMVSNEDMEDNTSKF